MASRVSPTRSNKALTLSPGLTGIVPTINKVKSSVKPEKVEKKTRQEPIKHLTLQDLRSKDQIRFARLVYDKITRSYFACWWVKDLQDKEKGIDASVDFKLGSKQDIYGLGVTKMDPKEIKNYEIVDPPPELPELVIE